MRNNSNSIGAFLDFFETSVILIDAKDCVVRTNQKLIDENKVFNFFEFGQNKSSYFINQVDKEDWYKCLNITLATGGTKFVLKTCSYECTMSRLLIGGEKYVLINLFEYKPQKEEASGFLLNDVRSPLIKDVYEKVAGVAHEINNPLTIILARTQILMQNIKDQKPIENEVLYQNLDKIYQQSDRIKKIVTDMRDYFSSLLHDDELEPEAVKIFKKSS